MGTVGRKSSPAEDRPLDRGNLSGYDDEAATCTAIAQCDGAVGSELQIPFNDTDDVHRIRGRIQSLLRIRMMEWELAVDDELISFTRGALRSLPSFWRKTHVEATLIPKDKLREWKRENPENAREAAAWKFLRPEHTDSAEPADKASVTWHLINPDTSNSVPWSKYCSQRQAAEEKLIKHLKWQEYGELRPLMQQIKRGAGGILNEITLDRSQIFAVLDGVIPLSIDIRDEGGSGRDITDADIYSRIYSPTKPSAVDVSFQYRCHARMNDIILETEVLYRIQDPIAERTLNIASGHIQAGMGGWKSLFSLSLDPNPPGRRWYRVYIPEWNLEPVDVDELQAALFGSNHILDKVQTIRLVLASVGVLLHVGRTEDEEDECNPDGAASVQWGWDYDDWIAVNIRKACGAPLQRDKNWKPRQFQDPYADYDNGEEDEDGEWSDEDYSGSDEQW